MGSLLDESEGYVDFSDITFEGQGTVKPSAIICDLDGTLALLNGRDPYDASTCMADKLNHPVYRLLRKYQKDGYKILIVSGRKQEFWGETQWWLQEHNLQPDKVLMRALGDRTRDDDLKQYWYENIIKKDYEVEFVLEDRDRCVEMYRKLGVTVFQVNKGNF